ncbi:DUF3889 domain-containing protein [Paenibacillus sp. MSJ-34]|uniref:DUF3889 domain-containing protein n=1 Tax=Paenibacillus sp. MSJ-34 TaxID=2841529 RepID=UPI001C10CC9B|nr:DUF3889 domain-containing protein [Paenibacillus sp. MSJ-34]MBU5442256.1 YqzG/YhdC family protein [Paenibacillus sp. MSJ-34]
MRILLLSVISLFFAAVVSASAEMAPEYAKWGQIAMEETQKRYQAEIVDYKHVGRQNISSEKAEETFKLWLRKSDGTEFGVYVAIQFDPSSNAILTIRFSETDR